MRRFPPLDATGVVSVLLGIALWANIAQGQGLTKIYQVPYQAIYNSAPEDVAVQATSVLHSELAGSEGLKILGGQELEGEGAVPEEEIEPTPLKEKELKKAAETAAGAEKLMRKSQFAKPATDYLKAIKFYEDGLVSLVDYQPLFDAYLNLSICYYRSAREEQGEQALANYIRLNPEAELDPGQHPPVFVDIFRKLKRNIMAAPRGSFKVKSTPPNARVFLNGRELGATPIELKEVMRGDHYLRIEAPGGRIFAEKHAAYAGRAEELNANFAGTRAAKTVGALPAVIHGLKNNTIDFDVREKSLAVANKVGAEYVVLGGFTAKNNAYEFHTYLLKTTGNQIVELMTVSIDQEMLGASIEMFKVGEDLRQRLSTFGQPLVQGKIAIVQGAVPKAETVAVVVAQPAYQEQPSGAPPPGLGMAPAPGPQPGGEPAGTAPAPMPGPRRVTTAPAEDIWDAINRPPVGSEEVVITEYVPWYERWWVWTIIGVAVVGGTVTAVILAQPAAPETATATIKIP